MRSSHDLSLVPQRMEVLSFAQSLKHRLFDESFPRFVLEDVWKFDVCSLAENGAGLLRVLNVYWEATEEGLRAGVRSTAAVESVSLNDAVEIVDRAARAEMKREGETSLGEVAGKLQKLDDKGEYFLAPEREISVSACTINGVHNVAINKWSGFKLLQENGASVGYLGAPVKTTVAYRQAYNNGVDRVIPTIEGANLGGPITRADLVDAAAVACDFGLLASPIRVYPNARLLNTNTMLGFYQTEGGLQVLSHEWEIHIANKGG